jgi:Cu+-exporting ATPase
VVKIGERFTADRIVDLARRAMRIIRQSLSLVLLFNVVGIALPVTGLLSPLIAAGAMLFSTFVVVGNSLRLHPAPAPQSNR